MILPDCLSLDQTHSPLVYNLARPAGRVAPPDSNTGVQSTEPQNMAAIVDWVAYTLPLGFGVSDALPGYDRLDWTQADHGGMGYKVQQVAGHISIFSDGAPHMGVHVVISGQGCRELEALGIVDEEWIGGWPGFFRALLDLDVKYTRLDIAVDDFKGQVDLDELKDNSARGYRTSRWKDLNPFNPHRSDGSLSGNGFTVGSRYSNVCGRWYDKDLEQAKKNKKKPNGNHWVRVEIELKKEAATKAATHIANGLEVGILLAGVLANNIQFRQPNPKDSNKYRWPLLPSWATFLNGVAKLSLSVKPEIKTVEQVEEWIESKLVSSLAVVFEARGADLDVFFRWVKSGVSRYRPKHLAMLAAAGLAPG